MADLRRRLSTLTHRGRVAAAIAAGRAGDPVVAAMAQGAVHERWLAGVAAFGDRDGQRVTGLMSDESQRVRGIAVTLVPEVCDDRQAFDAVRVAWSLRRERGLLRRLRRAGRTAPIDSFLDWLAARGHARELIDDLAFGSPAAVARHLAAALERPSQRLWRGLAGHHPAALADVLIARWQAAAGEADPVTRQLTGAHHATLADRAPDRGLALADLLLARGITPPATVWRALLGRRPDAAVDLAIRHAVRIPDEVVLARARELPAALLARMVGHADTLLGDLAWVRRVSADRQEAMARAWLVDVDRHPEPGRYLLRYLPAGPERERGFAAWSLAARDRDGVIAPAALRDLPVDLAAREAARHLDEVVALVTDPARRTAGYARYLRWDEQGDALATLLGHPDGAMRAVALRERLATPGLYLDETAWPAAALELVTARGFEQDPVRQAMFETLAVWPRRLWRVEHLPAVATALRAGLDAADLSGATHAAMERVVVRLFAVDPAWAAEWLATLVKERGTVADPRLGARLGPDEVRAAAPQLLAIAGTWIDQERDVWAVALADSLAERLLLVDGLAELLATARDRTPHGWTAHAMTSTLARWAPDVHDRTIDAAVQRFYDRGWYDYLVALAAADGLAPRQTARRRDRRRPALRPALVRGLDKVARLMRPRESNAAIDLLRRRAPRAFDDVVGELLRRDASVVALPAVHDWLHRHRQDLLDGFLGERVIRGAWATGRSRWILPFASGFFRWSPAQVERFATALEAIVGDRGRDTPAVLRALAVWPAMEYADLDRLCALADDQRPAVREKAIRVLARCDAGQGVPTLLACLGDARARFAIYGLRRALFAMLPDRALALLRDVSLAKVTVAKEVVRLTGELRAEASFARLEELAAGKLHRDVRIALLRALWDHLDRDATWAIFEQAVTDPDWVVASRLGDIPADRLTVELDRRLAALLGRVVARPEPEARIDLLRRAPALALADRERSFLAACRSRLASRHDDEIAAAATAVMARSSEDDVAALADQLDGMRADPRAFHVGAGALLDHDIRSRASWRRVAGAVEEVAARDPRWLALAIRAAGVHRDGPELVAALAGLAAGARLDVDAMLAARAAVGAVERDQLSDTTARLAAADSADLRRVAVWALARDAGKGRGWRADRLALLAALRADADPAVAGAAARLWPPRELEPGAAE